MCLFNASVYRQNGVISATAGMREIYLHAYSIINFFQELFRKRRLLVDIVLVADKHAYTQVFFKYRCTPIF